VPVEPVLIFLVVAVAANLALVAALVVPPLLARRQSRVERESRLPVPVDLRTEIELFVGPTSDSSMTDGVPTATYDRIVRLVAWLFILGASAVVGVTGLWRDTQPGILVVLALAGLMVLLVHDILPPGVLGRDKFVVEGTVAITLVTVLIILTGQESSPFFFAYPLIVAGAALAVAPWVTLVMAGLASIDYVIAITFDRNNVPISGQAMALVGLNIVSMLMLAYVASFIAREQRRSRAAAIRMSTIDSLTGLFNRAYFFAAVEREIQRSARSGRRFGLLMMDLDGLKAINDRFGHFQGDQALRAVAQVIRTGVRRIDIAARYGGDEFVVLLPETEPTGAFVVAEKIRIGVAELAVTSASEEIHTSMSIGAVSYPDDGTTADDLLISADRAMYVSKRHGKNRVVGYLPASAGRRDDDSSSVR
jgi:diguanylate cyclase (GGDEF)-like protein